MGITTTAPSMKSDRVSYNGENDNNPQCGYTRGSECPQGFASADSTSEPRPGNKNCSSSFPQPGQVKEIIRQLNFESSTHNADESTTELSGKTEAKFLLADLSAPPPPPQRMAKPEGTENMGAYEFIPSELLVTFRGEPLSQQIFDRLELHYEYSSLI